MKISLLQIKAEMKFTYILFSFLLLYCFKDKDISNPEKSNSIVQIHLLMTSGMIDMTKDISSKYYSLSKNTIYEIEELSTSKGEVIKTDTIKTINKDNSEIFQDLEKEINLESFFSEDLQDDSNGWSFAIYYSNKEIKNFTFTSNDITPKYASKLYDLLIKLENSY